MSENVCCFIGHREISESEELRQQLFSIVENLILEQNVDTFFFGSKSCFNSLCHELVTIAKEKHTHIKRIYVRAEFPLINDDYKSYLLENYEDTYYPEQIIGAGKAAYVERNQHMIKNSCFCVFYYKGDYGKRKSGTKLALDYALKEGKRIILL